MLARNAYDTYREQALSTSSSRELVGKAYAAAALALRRAAVAARENKIESAHNQILRAENIISALDGALDMSVPISSELHAIYDYLLRRMIEANVRKDTAIMDETAGLIAELRDTWEEAVKLAGR